MEDRMKSQAMQFFVVTVAIAISSIFVNNAFSQEKNFIGTKKIFQDGKVAIETFPEKNNGAIENLDEHFYGMNNANGDKYVLGGNVLWSTQDAVAIANVVAINSTGSSALTGWGLNNQRVTLYSDVNSNPIWDFTTGQIDPFIDISADGSKIAATAGTQFYLLNPVNGNIDFQFDLPDSLYASAVALSRDGSMAVVLAQAGGSSTTYRAYAFDISGSPIIEWTFDVQGSEILNWAGVNFSADGSNVAITGRNHLYIFNSSDGTLIWDHFVDNTESAPAISGDGKVVVTADNSGFVQTWHFDSLTNEYFKLWQYRIPVGAFTNWASSVGISADGKTIVAGSLIFYSAGYDGTVMCFDTYGDGMPKWVFANAGDLVDDIKLSDDGKVAAAVTWGDLAHTRPDLLVFDTQTGQVTFNVVSPGSFFTCDINPEGTRVFAGGKAVHAREFGNGGRIYLCEIDLGGGTVNGVANLTNTGDDSGILVKVLGTSRTATTNLSGSYTIQNVPAGTYTVQAEKPGYNFGTVTNVVVTDGGITSGVNMAMAPFTAQPPTLSASTNLMGMIMLNWTLLFTNPVRQKEIALMVGDEVGQIDVSQTATRTISEKENLNGSNSNYSDFILADSIAIYRSLVAGGPYQKIASVAATETSYNDMDVFALRNYYYVVNIFNETGQSIYSNESLGSVSDSLLTFSLDVPEASIPTIDGVLSAGEWDDAFKLDISDIFGYGGGVPRAQGSAFLYLKFDDTNDMLYIAGEDFLNPTLDDNEGFGLYFDDNNNNVFDGQIPFIQEGNFWAYWHPTGANLRFRPINGGAIGQVDTLFNAEVDFSASAGHLQGEFAIPMGFKEGYQLQIFGPDKIAGLGAFLIARQAGSPIYSGWWPQTMNTVFNPQYFGDVGIDVSLQAPPQPPSNISVTRQGEDLLITWEDPTLGINNDPLQVAPTINIYKNGEFLASVQTGVETYLDNEVFCVAWYEYQFEAYFIDGSDTLTGPMTSPFGAYACQEPVLVPISYDDGEWDGFYVPSFSWEENKWAVRFTPTSYPSYLRKVETIVNGNEAFDFTIQKDDGGFPSDIIAGPYRVNDNDPEIVATISKTLPGIDPPEITDGDVWVVINYLESTPGAPGVGVDSDPPLDGRTIQYLTSTGWTSFGSGDLMITAYFSDQPVGVENNNDKNIPLTFDLKQNYPNPFNPSTVIAYQIPQSEFVTLEIYNSIGEKVRTLVDGTQETGFYQVQWDGKNNSGNQLSSGVYLYRLSAGNYTNVMKMVLLR